MAMNVPVSTPWGIDLKQDILKTYIHDTSAQDEKAMRDRKIDRDMKHTLTSTGCARMPELRQQQQKIKKKK